MHLIFQSQNSILIIWLISIASIIGILSCTKQNSLDNNSISESAKTVYSLESQVKESIEYLNSENWIALYGYQNPKLREQRFPFGLEIAQPCSKETFIYNMVSITERIKSQNNLSDQIKLEFQLDTISIDSVTNIGKATINTYFNSDKNLIRRFEQRWIYRENQWWHQEENMQETCETLGKDLN